MNLCATLAVAHNSKIATYTLRDTGSGWFIEMAFAQASIDGAMDEILDVNPAELSSDDYKNQVISYIKNHFRLEANNRVIPLGEGGILLGSHQTDMKFLLPEMPSNLENINVVISAFDFSYNHTNIFRIYRGGERVSKFFLSADNDFTADLMINEQEVIQVKMEENTSSIGLTAILIMGLIAFIGLILFGLKTKTVSLSK